MPLLLALLGCIFITEEQTAARYDLDGDGLELDDDCDDNDPDVGGPSPWYADADGDGYGDGAPTSACQQPKGFVALDDDCDDGDDGVHPGAVDLCGDGVEGDCDPAGPCRWVGEHELADAVTYTLSGPGELVGAGYSVSGLTDLDGDGLGEILVGGPYVDDIGQSWVLYGGDLASGQIDEVAQTDLWTTADGAFLGSGAADAGDVDGDGVADLLLGSPGSSLVDYVGRAWLVPGAALGQSRVYVEDAGAGFLGDDDADGVGEAMDSAGDTDGDGLQDLILGAPGADRAWLIVRAHDAMGAGGGYASDLGYALSGDRAGWAVAGAGDTDGDGYDDVLVGAPEADDERGAAWLIRGPIDGDVSLSDADARWQGDDAGDGVGASLDGAGDADGDGALDVAIGGLTVSGGGRVYLASGPFAGRQDLPEPFEDPNGPWLGSAIAGVGDVDQDGLADVLMGADTLTSGDRFPGGAWLAYGGEDGLTGPAESGLLLGVSNESFTGFSVAGADPDGDGLPDLVIGAPFASGSATESGAVYVVLGSGTP